MSSTPAVRTRARNSHRLLGGALIALGLAWALTLAYPRLVMHGAPTAVVDTVGAVAWLGGIGVPLLAIAAVLARLRR